MNTKEIIIYLIFPLFGIIVYIFLVTKIWKEKSRNSILLEFFLIFANYGALIITILTFYLLNWSAVAVMVYFYVTIAAPIIMAIIAFRHRKNKKENNLYKYLYYSAISYIILFPLVCVLMYFS